MRKKTYKVKHFKTHYRRRNRFPFPKILLIILCIAGIFVLSYYLGGPLIDTIYNKITAPKPIPQDTSSQESPKIIDKISDECVDVRVINEEELTDTENYDKLVESLSGTKAVLIPLRTKNTMYFTTDKDLAIKAKLINKINATDLVSKLKSKGIYVIGEFETFADSSSAGLTYKTDLISMSVRFAPNPSYLCRVGDKDYFLSPASELTRDYISYLLADAAKTGVDEIILKGFHFLDNDKAMFSEDDEHLNKSSVLADFYSYLHSEVSSIKISVEVSAEDLLKVNEAKYGTAVSFENTVIRTDKISDELAALIKSDKSGIKRTSLTCDISEDYSAVKDKLVYVIKNSSKDGENDGK